MTSRHVLHLLPASGLAGCLVSGQPSHCSFPHWQAWLSAACQCCHHRRRFAAAVPAPAGGQPNCLQLPAPARHSALRHQPDHQVPIWCHLASAFIAWRVAHVMRCRSSSIACTARSSQMAPRLPAPAAGAMSSGTAAQTCLLALMAAAPPATPPATPLRCGSCPAEAPGLAARVLQAPVAPYRATS